MEFKSQSSLFEKKQKPSTKRWWFKPLVMLPQDLSQPPQEFESTKTWRFCIFWGVHPFTSHYHPWKGTAFYIPSHTLRESPVPNWIPSVCTHLKSLPAWIENATNQIFNTGHYIANPNNALLKENPLRFPLIHPPKMGNWMIPVEDHVLATFSCNPSCVHSFFHSL